MTATIPTLAQLQPNPHWAKLPLFDRKGWKTVRFGDVVENVNETVRAPAEAGIDRFIGLEHLEPGSLHIQDWGNVADSTTFTRRCRPGQVLPDWQHTTQGERLVQKELRRALLKYKLHTDQEVFERAYGYIRQYY